MTVDEYALIRISKSNKAKLDSYKLSKRESYDAVLDVLIEFGVLILYNIILIFLFFANFFVSTLLSTN